MSESFRQLLRALPDFPEVLPDFDPDAAPADPAELFRLWLERRWPPVCRSPTPAAWPQRMSSAGRPPGC